MKLLRAIAWAVLTIIDSVLLLVMWPIYRATERLAEGLQ